MPPLRLHALFEYGTDLKPFGTSQIRILRPFSHPGLKDEIILSSGIEYYGEDVDAIILDRLWRPEISMAYATNLLRDLHRAQIPFIYAIDDNLLDLQTETIDWSITREKERVVEYFLCEANGIIVTTPYLKQRFSEYNNNIIILQNSLDERLISSDNNKILDRNSGKSNPNTINNIVTIGYMGTYTHDSDLIMILPSIKKILENYPDRVRFQILGVASSNTLQSELKSLGCDFISVDPTFGEYSNFLPWFTSNIVWDISLSPLRDNNFTRAKSDIKFLDYCAIHSAGIYSKTESYVSSVKHFQTGLLVNNDIDDWYDAIELLINDNILRNKIRYNCWDYLHSSRTLNICANLYSKAIDNIINTSN